MRGRPSRFVIALARWGLMAGLAGVVLALLAAIDRLRAPENADSRYNLLIVSAVLLSLSFVLAPLVRRAFGVVREPRQARRHKTLLDEMRERAVDDIDRADELVTEPTAATVSAPPRVQILSRLIVSLYVVFALTLGSVLLAMR